jgi:putative ABC transport system substrate-binding protein
MFPQLIQFKTFCVSLVMAACLSPVLSVAQTKAVSVLTADSPAMSASSREVIREAFKDALKAGGFQESKNFRIQFESAQDSSEQLERVAKKIVASHPDVLIAMDARSAQAAIAATRQIPVVFARLEDPIRLGLLSAWAASGTNVTGVSNAVPLTKQLAVIRQLVSGARKVGVIYNPADKDSVDQLKVVQEQLALAGMSVVEASAQRPMDVGSAARSLIGRVDVFFTFADPNVSQSYAALIKVANDAKIPLIATDARSVRLGATAALVVLDRELGLQAGRMVVKILRGARAGSLAPEVARPQLILNTVAATKQGVGLTDAALKSAGEILK